MTIYAYWEVSYLWSFIIAIKQASTSFNFVGSNQDSSHIHDGHTRLYSCGHEVKPLIWSVRSLELKSLMSIPPLALGMNAKGKNRI